jgi:hypothetical protein
MARSGELNNHVPASRLMSGVGDCVFKLLAGLRLDFGGSTLPPDAPGILVWL